MSTSLGLRARHQSTSNPRIRSSACDLVSQALVVAGRLLLLGVRVEQGRIDIEDEPLGTGTEREGALARRLARGTDSLQLRLTDPLDQPERGRVRGDITEQVGLVAKRSEVRQVLAALDQGDDQLAQHPPVRVH